MTSEEEKVAAIRYLRARATAIIARASDQARALIATADAMSRGAHYEIATKVELEGEVKHRKRADCD
jgi:hypothetical protein